jgi:hypothetical protein
MVFYIGEICAANKERDRRLVAARIQEFVKES